MLVFTLCVAYLVQLSKQPFTCACSIHVTGNTFNLQLNIQRIPTSFGFAYAFVNVQERTFFNGHYK